jgi:hypothetical protein
MLSLILKRRYIDIHGQWLGVKRPTETELQTMWSGVLDENRVRDSITNYTIHLVQALRPYYPVIPYNPPESQPTHVYRKFIDEIIQLVTWANVHEMECRNCEQLLVWATHMWDLILESDNSREKDEIKNEFQVTMDKLIDAFRRREAGPSSRTEIEG